jgi:hypothetical protein
MKNIAIILIFGMTLLSSGKVFSQAGQPENKTEISDSGSSKLFNEGGYVRGITTARAIGLAELLLSILSIVFSVRAKKRSSIKVAKTALTMGLLAVIFSIVHFISVAGAVFGSGSGKAGAILAILLSLVGITISSLVLRKKKV